MGHGFHEHHKGERSDLELLYTRAHELILYNQINPNGFRDLYGNENVDRDLAAVDRLEQDFEHDSTRRQTWALKPATILEAIIYEQGEQSDWFGPDATTVKTSRFDDIINGIDSAVEFFDNINAPSHLAFGIDATYSNYIDKKIEKIQHKITTNRLATIKYFQSEQTGFRGELRGVPLFIVAVTPDTISSVGELWAANEHQELAHHPIQLQILQELVDQATKFELYAGKQGKENAARKYSAIGTKVESILADKKRSIRQDHDLAYYELENRLAKLLDTNV